MRCRRSTGAAHVSNIFTKSENNKWLSGYAALAGLAVISVFRQNLENAEKYASQLRELVVYGKKFSISVLAPIFGLMKDQEFAKSFLDALQQLEVPEKPPSG